jgi:hypothetical protein
MPRFTVKDLLIATTLVAIGAGASAFAYHNEPILTRDGPGEMALFLLLWFGGGTLIGAGLFTPFKRPWTGFIVAFVLEVLLVMLGGAVG